MAFKPEEHLRSLKGQSYLDVKWRLLWLRDEYPHSTIDTELVTFDPDREGGFYIFRAKVVLIDANGEMHGSATGYGTQTQKAFPTGAAEKGETKAIGRALAACGLGAQFALEAGDDDDGDNLSDSPVARATAPRRNDQQGLKTVADASAFRPAQLKSEVAGLLAKDTDGAALLKKTADEMSPEELDKALTWLRNRTKRVQ